MKKILLILWALILPTIFLSVANAQGPQRLCYTSDGKNCIQAVAAQSSVKIDIATGTTTQLVALATNQSIFVTSWDVMAGGTGTFKLVYGTGSNCGTGTTDLTGAYPLTAQNGISKGDGLGLVLFVPRGNALCATTSAAVQYSGSVSYAQFQP